MRRRTALALILLVVVALGPFVTSFTAQTGSRYGFAAAVVDDGTIRLDRYEPLLGADDFVERGGHRYSDKAPGHLLVAVPAYASARLVGADPASDLRVREDLGAWWVTLAGTVVPTALLCALIYRVAETRHPGTAVQAALGLTFGTLLLVCATTMYAHALSALLGFGAWALVRQVPVSRRTLLAAGALVGAAVATEYTLAIVGVVVVAWLLSQGERARLGWLALGGLPWALLLAAYHQVSYGSPFTTAYSLKPTFDSPTLVGVPDLGTAAATLAGERGILVITPIVLLGLIGCVQQLRRHEDRRDAIAALVVFGAFTLLYSSWIDPWGGEVPGPRYLTPALPFLGVPLAAIWSRHRRVCTLAAIFGGIVLGVGVLTYHLVSLDDLLVATYLRRLQDGATTPTVLTMLVGPAGWILHAAAVAGAAVLLHRCRDASADEEAGATVAPAV